jgi:hypothetical protein
MVQSVKIVIEESDGGLIEWELDPDESTFKGWRETAQRLSDDGRFMETIPVGPRYVEIKGTVRDET